MLKPTPRQIYLDPQAHWALLTSPRDSDFEDQHFDRKEAGRPRPDGSIARNQVDGVRDLVQKTVSAFTNSNPEGGLLVLGVSRDGSVEGINHLSEDQVNSITNINALLRNHATEVKTHHCVNVQGDPDAVLLIYCPYTSVGICETLSDNPEAWERNGPQSIPLSRNRRQQIERDKQITNFEESFCCPFHPDDVDVEVVDHFKKRIDYGYDQDLDDFLYRVGALQRDGSGYAFTTAGFLFFGLNPQSRLPWSYIRLLRFEVDIENYDSPGANTLERKFDGALPQQIRKLRAFFKESGFFKVYTRRQPEGGFIEEEELPFIAVDEALVNAVAHRDYGIQQPVECIHYKDALYVRNPGRLLQRDGEPPHDFTLDNYRLVHTPRNPKLIEWLKTMGDEQGTAFVRALSEGTKQMQASMDGLKLPPPQYRTDARDTSVTLYNNAEEREARYRASSAASSVTEYLNVFRLQITTAEGHEDTLDGDEIRAELVEALKNALVAKGWYIDKDYYGTIRVHKKGMPASLDSKVLEVVHMFPAYELQVRSYWDTLYLCIDYVLEVKNVLAADALLQHLIPADLVGRRGVARVVSWQKCKILEVGEDSVKVRLFDLETDDWVPTSTVIPELSSSQIQRVLAARSIQFNLPLTIKQLSLSARSGAARKRAERCIATAQALSDSVFPLSVGSRIVTLSPVPTSVDPASKQLTPFTLKRLPEPTVEFRGEREAKDIREGITNFGSYEDDKREIEIIPICHQDLRDQMGELISRLRGGKYKYRGSERTFGARLSYRTITTVRSPEEVENECQRLLDEHPDWIGAPGLDRIFLVHTPEAGYERDDVSSPYYRVKRLLLEKGIPCQMVDSSTILDPDWKDLNLALNIAAKCGITPWILPNRIPDADFFIGLSYTRSRQEGSRRLMGYATVFNRYGRWEYFTGKPETFSYDERGQHFAKLTRETLERLDSLPNSPFIFFHYSAKFSKDDERAIIDAAREIKPEGTYSFVILNTHHKLRLYDSRPETDGSVTRGSYVPLTPNQILISTTGFNPYKRSIGTPMPLEVTIRTYLPGGGRTEVYDLRALAVQILSLTKLNWGSTEAISSEPITTKYAGEIAYLTDAFIRQGGDFVLHPVLERTPWFI